MDRNRIIIAVAILCALAVVISLLAVFIPRSKTKENLSSSFFNIATTDSTIVDFTTSKYYTNNQSTTDSTLQPSATSSQTKTVATTAIDTVTTTGTTQVVTSNKLEISTGKQISYWSLDAPLKHGRSEFGSALLTNQSIIISGGDFNSTTITSSCNTYSSSSGWQIARSMKTDRYAHTLTAFANNTKALAAGTGRRIGQQTAEVFDSTNNTWTYTTGNMSSARCDHTATLLTNGQILIVGGRNATSLPTASADIYNPLSNSFINTSNMLIGRYLHVSTLLSDGSTVLVTGGRDSPYSISSRAELYIGGSWITTNNNMTQPRVYHAAVLLNDGNVLIAGGGTGVYYSYATAEIYNATTRTFTAVGSMKYRRGAFTLTLLPSGKVLATGGIDWTAKKYPEVCELYDPLTRAWSNTSMLNYGRSYHETILLDDSVLTIGGQNGSDTTRIATSEKYYL